MNPYLEGPHWHPFHTTFCVEIARQLTPKLGPKYVVLTEEWLTLEPIEEISIAARRMWPDVSVIREEKARYGTAVIDPPLEMAVPMELETKVRFLEIRNVDGLELVTSIELFSPANKRGSTREDYLEKRRRILSSEVHLVEIDLLRGGQRVPMEQRFPPQPYFVLVHRVDKRPIADVWPISLERRLPIIPIPLADGDPDVELDLQLALEGSFETSRFERLLNYRLPPSDAFTNEERQWIEEVLVKSQLRG